MEFLSSKKEKKMEFLSRYSQKPDSERPKIQTLDRITVLPDTILLHIFSFLPMEDVVKTCILSKQWRFLWTTVSALMFSHRNQPDEDLCKFISFVDKTLVLINCPKLKIFSVDFAYHRRFSADVNVWLCFVTKHGVEELKLDFSNKHNFGSGLFQLPQHLYSNGSFVKLSLSMCGIVPKGLISWKSLKSLTIGSTELSGNMIGNIVLGSPVLNFLELFNCWGFDKLEINGGSLRKLVINGYLNQKKGDSVVEIWAPGVRSLDILGCLHGKIIQLENISSTVDAKLDFYLTKINHDADDDFKMEKFMLSDMLVSIQLIKYLTFGTWFIEVLSMLEIKGLPSVLPKCKRLMLHTPIQERYLSGIVNLLHSSPDVETLIINMTPPSFEFETCFNAKISNFFNVDGESYWTSKQKLFRCLDLRLKTIRISGFEGRHCGLEIPFLQFLLKSSRALEKMVINGRGVGQDDLVRGAFQDQLQVAESLLSFPRSSKGAVIIFKH
ncbi:unnamed protein product [Ilex paraguariensis]|uniref:F-box domain-containing protein n=1 Tax=Ilex paraguariensis TaxID=185542 RepID=A0ABC8STN4_9AQUA